MEKINYHFVGQNLNNKVVDLPFQKFSVATEWNVFVRKNNVNFINILNNKN